MSDGKPIYRVLVRQADRIEGASVVTPLVYEEVTFEQFLAYSEGRSDWRSAKSSGGWWSRSWRRIFATE